MSRIIAGESKASYTDSMLKLTSQELAICGFLLKKNDELGLGITFRFAGGWTRDKILGRESDDIDIAIDKMTGKQFAQAAGLRASILEADPDQSKHLEVAIVEICGRKVEIANLRDESWAGAYKDSRILAENRFGTPLSDAQRRDLTINAIFFNINTMEIEDLVGGVADLGFKIQDGKLIQISDMIDLRTPLPVKQTLLDDPLRMLRAARFASKLEGAVMVDELYECMRDPEVQAAFKSRITQERIAVELLGKRDKEDYKTGIFNYQNAWEAVWILGDVGLLDIILDVPEMAGFKPFRMDQNNRYHAYDVFEHTTKVMLNLWFQQPFLDLPPEKQALLQFAALLHDLGKRDPKCCQLKADGMNSYHGHEDSSAVVARAICNKLAMSNDDTSYVVNIVKAHMDPHPQEWGSARVLRRFRHNYPDEWQDIIVHAKCDVLSTGTLRPQKEIDRYDELLDRGLQLVVDDRNAPSTHKPIIDGRRVMEMIPEILPKTGFIREVNAALLEMRLEAPETTVEQYEAKILEMKPALLEKHAN